ncbi:MAG: hypothetical protein WCF67_10785 [Chitinophagaceae bacterium]
MKRIYFVLMIAAICFCDYSIAQTPRINFKAPMAYPEGTAYNPSKNLFYVSSVRTGTIGTVNDKGVYTVFYEDASLKSSYGMKVDAKRNKLWVCTGDANYSMYSDPSTYKKKIRLIGLDLNTGKKTDDIDLSNLIEGKHFANDLTLDDKGNIYITDSYSPVIYQVDANMKASIFAKNDLFKSEDVGLNGIVWSSKGYLVVAHNTKGQLLKVSTAQPGSVTVIKTKSFFPGADGLLWDQNENLVLIQNKGVNKVFRLSSADNWQSAEIEAYTLMEDRFHYPTTSTLANGKIYSLNAKLNELTDPTVNPSKEFSLQQVRFMPAK